MFHEAYNTDTALENQIQNSWFKQLLPMSFPRELSEELSKKHELKKVLVFWMVRCMSIGKF